MFGPVFFNGRESYIVVHRLLISVLSWHLPSTSSRVRPVASHLVLLFPPLPAAPLIGMANPSDCSSSSSRKRPVASLSPPLNVQRVSSLGWTGLSSRVAPVCSRASTAIYNRLQDLALASSFHKTLPPLPLTTPSLVSPLTRPLCGIDAHPILCFVFVGRSDDPAACLALMMCQMPIQSVMVGSMPIPSFVLFVGRSDNPSACLALMMCQMPIPSVVLSLIRDLKTPSLVLP